MISHKQGVNLIKRNKMRNFCNFCIFFLLTTITLSSLIHGRPHLSERVEIRESQVESSTGTFIQVLSWYFLIFIFNILVREIQNTATQTILITSCPGGRDLIGGVCRKSEKRIHSFQWNNKGKINEVNDLQHLYFNKMLWHYLKFTIVSLLLSCFLLHP